MLLFFRHSLRQNSDTVLPVLLTNCRNSISKPLPPACVVRGCGRKPAGSSGRSATVHMVCRYRRICWSRTSAPAARTRSGRVISRIVRPEFRVGMDAQMNHELVWNIEPVTHDGKPNNPTGCDGGEPERQ